MARDLRVVLDISETVQIQALWYFTADDQEPFTSFDLTAGTEYEGSASAYNHDNQHGAWM